MGSLHFQIEKITEEENRAYTQTDATIQGQNDDEVLPTPVNTKQQITHDFQTMVINVGERADETRNYSLTYVAVSRGTNRAYTQTDTTTQDNNDNKLLTTPVNTEQQSTHDSDNEPPITRSRNSKSSDQKKLIYLPTNIK
jgi:hypothetical protein